MMCPPCQNFWVPFTPSVLSEAGKQAVGDGWAPASFWGREPHAFGERPVLKLMCAASIRVSESWRGVKVTEFETRQLQALHDDLQRAPAERVSPVVRVSTESRPAKVSSKNKT